MSSRRPANPAAERAAKNQATIKSLLKLEANKICSDCKKNKHPRWASWNLGVFICIRCSGIHRGMGTHISRVKSVDLDSWTDEQLQSILSWGNARANKYWEAKLAPGHVPSESKIENFIRTKYDLKRWVMDGPMPDPASLDVDEDDNVPLSVVKEKQNVERRESVRKTGSPPQPRSAGVSAPQFDLIGGDDIPPRASTAGPPAASQVPPKAAPAAPKATNTKDSLLGLDFFGDPPAAPSRPASTASVGGGAAQSRPDLKQSILSLYASAPKPQPQQPSHGPSGSVGSFGGMQSPTMGHQPKPSAGLNDAFAGLSFGSNVSSPKSPPQKDAFAGLTSMSAKSPPPQQQSAFSNLSGGSFFDAKPAQPAAPQQTSQSSSGFGSFASPAPAPAAAPKPVQSSSSGLGDLFDWSAPAPQAAPAAPKAAPAPAPAASSSVFNLSANPPKPAPAPASAATAGNPGGSVNASALSGADVWGNAWGEPEASAPAPKAAQPSSNPLGGLGGGSGDMGGWGASSGSATGGSFATQSIVPGASGGFAATGGSFANQSLVPGSSGGFTAAPKVAADEEFGGWASSTGTGAAKPSGGFAGSEDLFSNVWE